MNVLSITDKFMGRAEGPCAMVEEKLLMKDYVETLLVRENGGGK